MFDYFHVCLFGVLTALCLSVWPLKNLGNKCFSDVGFSHFLEVCTKMGFLFHGSGEKLIFMELNYI